MPLNRRQAIGLACTAAAGLGAVASGPVFPVVSSDAGSIADAFNKCIAAGEGVVHFPAGEYRLDHPIEVDLPANVGIAIRGDGPGISRITWTGSVDGLVLKFPAASAGAVLVQGLSLLTTKPATGSALRLECRGGTSPNPIKRVRNVSIAGGWSVGVDCVECTFTTLDDIDFEGGGVAVRFSGQHEPVDNYITRLRVRSAAAGVEVSGNCEGVYMAQSTMIGVERGVHWHTTAGEPLLSLTGCHIAASRECVLGHNLIQPIIMGNLLYQAGRAEAWAGIRLSADASSIYDLLQVSHNTIHGFPREGAKTTTGILIANRTGGVVQGNIIRDVQVGISLDEKSGGVRVLDNYFDQCTMADVLDKGKGNLIRRI
jgi:hypothetical protein